MAEKTFEAGDPMTLAGMVVAAPPAESRAVAERMAACLAEEYLLMGWSDDEVVGLFRNPCYRATHAFYREHGEAGVRALLARARAGGSDDGQGL